MFLLDTKSTIIISNSNFLYNGIKTVVSDRANLKSFDSYSLTCENSTFL